MPKIKAFTIPRSVLPAALREVRAGPKAENIDPKMPHFSVEGLSIQGKAVGSALEWNVAIGLDEFELNYEYQVPVFGGRVSGGSVVDFLVHLPVQGVFIFAQGDYWHTRGNKEDEDAFLFARIEAAYHKKVVQIWEHEALTTSMTAQAIKEKLKL